MPLACKTRAAALPDRMNHEGRYARQGDYPSDRKGQNLLHAVSSLVKDGFKCAFYYMALTLLLNANIMRPLLSTAEGGFFRFSAEFLFRASVKGTNPCPPLQGVVGFMVRLRGFGNALTLRLCAPNAHLVWQIAGGKRGGGD